MLDLVALLLLNSPFKPSLFCTVAPNSPSGASRFKPSFFQQRAQMMPLQGGEKKVERLGLRGYLQRKKNDLHASTVHMRPTGKPKAGLRKRDS